MGAAAELTRPIAERHHADYVAVFFVEKRNGPAGLCFLKRQFFNSTGQVCADLLIETAGDPIDFLSFERPWETEIEGSVVRLNR